MRSGNRALLTGALLTSISGCAGAAPADYTRTGPKARPNATIVLQAEQLQSSTSNLLSALRGRLSGMQVRKSASECPEITLRGTNSMFGENSPAIYVDGSRAVNTCVLDMLVTADVSRVEVYPMGVAPDPPYKAHSNGLILVFLKDGRP